MKKYYLFLVISILLIIIIPTNVFAQSKNIGVLEKSLTSSQKYNLEIVSLADDQQILPNVQDLNCNLLLGDPTDSENLSPAYLLTYAFKIIRYVAIILLVVLTIMDFVSSTASQDADSVKKSVEKAITRVILCLIIFLLPYIIEFVLNFIYKRAMSICINS